MSTLRDAWQGYQIDYPDGWRILYPPLEGVAFDAPDGSAFLECSQVQAGSAMEALGQRLGRIPQHEARRLEDTPTQAAILFRHANGAGEMRARCQNGRATVILAQAREGSALDLTDLIRQTSQSLRPLPPSPRQSWHEPSEGCCQLLCPPNWRVDCGMAPDRTGIRQPICRVSLNRTTFLHLEADFHSFTQGPPEFFGEVHLPMCGLYPVLEGAYLGRWGAQVLDFDDFGNPLEAEARLRLPDGLQRVVKLSGAPLPNSPRWVAGACYYYQAPPQEMEQLESLFRGIARSYKINPQWQNQQRAMQNAQFQAQHSQQTQQWTNLSQNLHQQRMHDIQMQGQANTVRHEMRMQDGFQERLDSMDRMQHDNINSIREEADYLDPQSGQVHVLSAHHHQVWSDGQGHWLTADWDIQPPPEWHKLERLDPSQRY